MTTVTTTTGNTVVLAGFDATVKGITFEVRKAAGGIVSDAPVKAAGFRVIELALVGAELAKAHAHLDAEIAKIVAQAEVEHAHSYRAAKIHAGNGDAAANRG